MTADGNTIPEIRFAGFTGDWDETPMGKLLSFKNGYNAGKEQYGKGKKFINVLDIIENDYITHERIIGQVDIPPKDFDENEVKFGDILFQRSSETREEVGQANVYLDQDKTATFGGFVIRGRPLSDFDPVFFNAMLKTAKARKDITSRSGGSTRYNIGQESLEDVLVSIAPTLPEQRKIADFLTAVDGRIVQLIQKKALLEDYKKGMMQKLFTQAIRFKDDHGNDFPDWEKKKLGDIVQANRRITYGIVQPGAFVEEGVPLVRGMNYSKGWSPLSEIKNVTAEIDKPYKRSKLLAGDVLITIVGANTGLVAIVPEWLSGANITQTTARIAVDSSKAHPAFVEQILKSRHGRLEVAKYIKGAAQPGLNLSDLEKFSIPVPNPDEQTKIADFLSAIDRKIESVATQITETQTFKRGLLQQMFV